MFCTIFDDLGRLSAHFGVVVTKRGDVSDDGSRVVMVRGSGVASNYPSSATIIGPAKALVEYRGKTLPYYPAFVGFVDLDVALLEDWFSLGSCPLPCRSTCLVWRLIWRESKKHFDSP
jgi:hypothetical protein